MERNVYSPHSVSRCLCHSGHSTSCCSARLASPYLRFRCCGFPVLAAGVVNGVGHYFGYRNFQSEDASTNIVPWGILIGGEELHNNHHAYASSAKLSNRWYEFDIGWFYIRIWKSLGWRRSRRLPRPFDSKPKVAVRRGHAASRVDPSLRRAGALCPLAEEDLGGRTCQIACPAGETSRLRSRKFNRCCIVDAQQMPQQEQERLVQALEHSKVLHTIFTMREELAAAVEALDGYSRAIGPSARRLVPSCRAERHCRACRIFPGRLRGYA